MSNDRVILETQRLSRSVGGVKLVDQVSIQIQAGRVVAIVRPGGSGKSSFLRLLNRLDEPTSGTVVLDGVDYRQLPPQELRRRVGMLLQAPHLLPGTVEANIRFGSQQRGVELPPDLLHDLLGRVGLGSMVARDVANLSGGEAQRVSLARTLANSPDVLLLDELTSALYETTRMGVEELICSIVLFATAGLTALVITRLVRTRAFSPAQQLLLRPGQTGEGATA